MKLIQEQISAHATLTCYLHEPNRQQLNVGRYPSVLVLPGGGFRVCSAVEGEPVAMAFFAEGYDAFVLDYTTVTKKPDAVIGDPMRDVELSLAWIRSHGDENHISADKVAMIGFSGGAHLAAAVATHCENRPDALILGYPGIIHSDLRALDCPDIVERVDEATPPSFIFTTRNDTVTPPAHALAFANALEKAGVDFELHIFRSGDHGSSLGTAWTSGGSRDHVNPAFARWFPMCLTWLEAVFGGFTIFGVTDGRVGKYSIDTPLFELLKCEAAKKILEDSPLDLAALTAMPQNLYATLRSFQWGAPDFSAETLAELDRVLLVLENCQL